LKIIIQILITISALIIGIIHTIHPDYSIDTIGFAFFVIAIAPWVTHLFKRLELPGVKIEFKDLERAAKKADEAGLLADESDVENLNYSFQYIYDQDPNLALAGLRIEIEKKLNKLAELNNIDPRYKGAGRLLRILEKKEVLSFSQQGVLNELLNILNNAVHGANVDNNAINWAMDIGLRILKSLDNRIKKEIPYPESKE
jgi:hypothetical protein